MQRIAELKRPLVDPAEAQNRFEAEIAEVGPPAIEACSMCRSEGSVVWRNVRVVCPLVDKPECRVTVNREKSWLAIGIGKRYREAASWDRVPQGIATPLRSYCENLRTSRNLILTGGVGSGKTCALVLTARAAHEADLSVLWRYTPQLFDELHRQDDALEYAHLVGLLVLDDFGVQYAADWNTSRFDALIEARYADERPVAVSTNRDWKDLAADPIWARAVSRWRQDAVIIATGDVDQRRRRQ